MSASGQPAALRDAAVRLSAQGQFTEAAAALQQLVALDPTDANAWAAFSNALLTDRRPQAALEASDAGLTRAPGSPGLHCARARALQTVSRVAEASAALQQALAIDPACGEAQFGLALQAIEAGDWDGAATIAAPLLNAASGGPQIDWLAARIALGRGDLAPALERASRVLVSPALAPQQEAETALLMGEALDGLGRHAEAFRAFTRGKSVLRRLYAQRAASRESEAGKLLRLADWFRAADPTPWQQRPKAVSEAPARSHVFLVGFPRSGTTLLEQALAGNPGLAALEEAPTLAEAYDELLASPEGLARLAQLTPGEAEHWRAVYWRVVAERGLDVAGSVFLDKAPAGTMYLPLVAKLFPDATVLFAVRDPRDVVLSCFRNSFQMNALTYAFTDLAETARCYAATMGLASIYRDLLPIKFHEVRYERLVDDFAGELARIAGRLGLAMTPGMSDVAATAARRVVRTPSAPQVRAGLNRQGLGRWRAYASELAPVMPILAPWIEALGYGGTG